MGRASHDNQFIYVVCEKFRGIFFDVVELTPTDEKVKIYYIPFFLRRWRFSKIAQFYFMDVWLTPSIERSPRSTHQRDTHGTNYHDYSAATSPDPPPERHGDKHVTRVLVIENNYEEKSLRIYHLGW